MSFKGVCTLLAIALVAMVMTEGNNDSVLDAGDEKTKEIDEILFRADGEGLGKVNGTDEADNSTMDEDPSVLVQTTQAPGDHTKHSPIRFGQWTVLGCHNDDETWGCEVRRMLHASTYGFMDSLRFTVRKDKSLKMAKTKERCESCVAKSPGQTSFRIVVECPKQEECAENVLRRLKVVYFQMGFLCAVAIGLASLLCCACLCKAFDLTKSGTEGAKLISKNAVSSKW